MINLLLTKKDLDFLKKIESGNSDEMLAWKLPNLVFPLVTIILSLGCFFLFKDNSKINFTSFFNLLLNGSLPMLALSRLSSLGVNLFKFDKNKEKNIGKFDTYNLRITIHYYSLGLVFIIAIFYIYQVIYTLFDLKWTILIQISLAVWFIIQSLKISKYGYILQEKMLERTIGDDIKETVNETKKHLAEKYES